MQPCHDIRPLVGLLLDEELAGEEQHVVEQHVLKCACCHGHYEREACLRRVVRQVGLTPKAPVSLRKRTQALLHGEIRNTRQSQRVWPVAMAAMALFSLVFHGPDQGQELAHAVAKHTRNLPMDVVAGEANSVQSYLRGKLPFPVRLPEFSGEPVQRFGGRVIELRDRDAAYVRYDTPRGQVSLFVYEDVDDWRPEVEPMYQLGRQRVWIQRVHGFTAARWRQSGLVYSIVTDLPERDITGVLWAAPNYAQ